MGSELPDGLPGSVTLLGRSGEDGLVAATARIIEAGEVLSVGKPDAPGLRDDEIALAVCGAHLSGLPLNHELTARGGRLQEVTRTAPRYGFFALAGGPPARPGLLRRDCGAAIEAEVWALPKTTLGEFLAGIPSPLSIGTVELEDGSEVHGFLVEAAGLDGATDISDLSSWLQLSCVDEGRQRGINSNRDQFRPQGVRTIAPRPRRPDQRVRAIARR